MDILQDEHTSPDFLFVNKEKEDDTTAWTQNNNWTDNNYWNQMDFDQRTRGVQPAFSAEKGGPGCDFLFNAWTLKDRPEIKQQLAKKIHSLNERRANGDTGIWMYLDSGASRSVIQEESPIRALLSNISETQGSCNVGNGANLKYLEKGMLTTNNEVTVVQSLKYDLYAAVAAAKRGVSCVLDYDTNGTNRSFLIDKKSGIATPLIERKKGILEVPVHLFTDNNDKGLKVTENLIPTIKLSKASVAKFWFGMDKGEFDPYTRDNNSDEISLFTFDIINSLGQRQKDFLIHARLAHLPRKAILQLIKDGAMGLPYKGKFKELCRPCLESRQRAENHGKQLTRHPNGKFGEHLHSDLAIVNIPDFKGFKYVLTVVDEISDEVIITLLKSKSAEVVLSACKNTHKIITARCKSQIKSWQFDRGSEFLNDLFEEWITRELGATQLFSNIEHPWENGRAERSFGTLFQKARAMLKYADLPNATWGKAMAHAAYLKNRSPSTRLNLLSPLQFRTGEAQDFTRLRVFGCPAQIFVRATKRENNKLSDRSEKGTLIGMSTLGNGYIFRVQRTNQIVEIDSRDAKFNETFSDCIDRKGRKIKGGKVLDPDLFNEPEMAYDMMKALEEWNTKKDSISRFSSTNSFDSLDDENNEDVKDKDDNDSDNSEDDNDPDNSDEDNVQSHEDSMSTKNLPGPIKTSKKSREVSMSTKNLHGPIKTFK